MESFNNGNGKESQNKSKRNKKENRNPNKSINHVEFYFSLNGYKCNLHFWHTRMNFLVLRKTDFLVLVQVCASFVVNENPNIFNTCQYYWIYCS